MVHQSLETVMEQMSVTKRGRIWLHMKVWKQSWLSWIPKERNPAQGSIKLRADEDKPSCEADGSQVWGDPPQSSLQGHPSLEGEHRLPTHRIKTGREIPAQTQQGGAPNPPSLRDGSVTITRAVGGTRVWALKAQSGDKESALKQSSSVTLQIGILNDRKTLQTGTIPSAASLRIC